MGSQRGIDRYSRTGLLTLDCRAWGDPKSAFFLACISRVPSCPLSAHMAEGFGTGGDTWYRNLGSYRTTRLPIKGTCREAGLELRV